MQPSSERRHVKCYLVATTTWPTTVPMLKALSPAHPLLPTSHAVLLSRVAVVLHSADTLRQYAINVPPMSYRLHVVRIHHILGLFLYVTNSRHVV